MTPLEYPYSKGRRGVLMLAAVLCILLVVPIPFAIWVLWRRSLGLVRVSDSDLFVRSLAGSFTLPWSEVERLGLLKVAVNGAAGAGAGGLVGAMVMREVAKASAGGSYAFSLWMKVRGGKQRNLLLSNYEQWDQILAETEKRTGRSLEELKTGLLFGPRWPKPAA